LSQCEGEAHSRIDFVIIGGYVLGSVTHSFGNAEYKFPATGHRERVWSVAPCLGASICPGNGLGVGSFGGAIILDHSRQRKYE